MKILSLQAENVKKIKAIDITPTGDVIEITGRNGQGKTSVLDSIWMALGGKNTFPHKPIREGQDRAEIKIDLGDYIVQRIWTSNETSYLQVTTKEGAKYPSPQSLLDKMIGNLSFDPLEFSRMKQEAQRELLAKVIGLDLSQFDKAYREFYEARRLVGARMKQFNIEALSPEAQLPNEEISSADVMAELQGANAVIKNNNILRNNVKDCALVINSIDIERDNLNREKENLLKKIEDVESKISNNLADRAKATEKHMAAIDAADNLVDPDMAKLTAKLQDIEEQNKQIRAENKNREIRKKHAETKAEYDQLTEKIDATMGLKKQTITEAKFPIPGLTFSVVDGTILYAGIPLDQCSASEQLKVSMALAMAINPKVRVIRITDGSLLDDSNLASIKEMARDNDFQIWIERVDASGQVGIYIEDGEVKAVNNAN